MKRLIVFIIAIMMVVTVYATSAIQVTKPGAGNTVYQGFTNDYMIEWTVTGQVHEFVKIRLFDKTGSTQIYKITDKTPSANGQFPWPRNMINNTNYGDYVIMVKTLDNDDWDTSGVFHVKKKTGILKAVPKLSVKPIRNYQIIKKKITVSNPVKNESYEINKPISIAWDKNFGNYEYVKVYIYYIGSTNQVTIRGTTVNNTGVSSWTPTSIFNNYPVFVEVTTSDNKFLGKSGSFVITLPPAEEMQ